MYESVQAKQVGERVIENAKDIDKSVQESVPAAKNRLKKRAA